MFTTHRDVPVAGVNQFGADKVLVGPLEVVHHILEHPGDVH